METVKETSSNAESDLQTNDISLNSIVKEDTHVTSNYSTFGIGRWRPKSLQCLASLWGFVGLYSPCALFKVTILQYTRSQITSIERHFRINSAKSGILLSSIDYGSICFALVGSYFGKFSHIPRLLSLSAVLVGIAVISVSFVQIATPRTLPDGNEYKGLEEWKRLRNLCWSRGDLTHLNLSINEFEKFVKGDSRSNTDVPWTYFTMMLALFVSGALMSYKVPLQTFYVEQNVKKKSESGNYIGVLIAAMVFGSPMALFLGGIMNKEPVDLKETKMHTSDPRWISAWWLGYVVIGIFSITTSIPVFCLPRYITYKEEEAIPDDKDSLGTEAAAKSEIRRAQSSSTEPEKYLLCVTDKIPDYTNGAQTENTDGKHGVQTKPTNDTQTSSKIRTNGEISSSKPERGLLEKLSDWPRSLKRILSNRVVVLLVVEEFIFFTGALGTSSFQLKYLENEFDKPASTINFFLGIGQLLTAVTGTLAGGVITSRYNLSRSAMFKMAFITQFTAFLLSSFFVLLGCDNHIIRGFNDFSWNQTDFNCTCSDDTILFVCGSDGFNYLSPCLAGCREVDGLNYKNCSQIPDESTAEPGFCDNGCNMFTPVIIIYVILRFVATFGLAPRTLMAIRSVAKEDQSLVVGMISGLVLRAAAIAGPVIFGRVYDSTCLLWTKGHGSCKLTDKYDLRYVFLGTGFLVRAVGVFFLFIATVIVHWEDKNGERRDDLEILVKNDDIDEAKDDVGVEDVDDKH